MTNYYGIAAFPGNTDFGNSFFSIDTQNKTKNYTASEICDYLKCAGTSCASSNSWIIPVAIIATLLLFSRRKEKR
jgi:hypothetical protein